MNPDTPNAMNEPLPDPQLERDIARLVDGELPESQLAQLLRQLEATPHGWRWCALGFIESQVLASAIDQMATASQKQDVLQVEPHSPQRSTPSFHRESSAPTHKWRIAVWGYAAVCALLAFLFSQGFFTPTTPVDAPNAGESEIAGKDFPPTVAKDRTGASTDLPNVHFQDLGPALGSVTLRSDDQSSPSVTLPVFADSQAHVERFLEPTFGEELQQALRAAGHRLNHRMSYEPVLIGNDQVMFVPVEEVEIVPNPNLSIIP